MKSEKNSLPTGIRFSPLDIETAYGRIRTDILATPILASPAFDSLVPQVEVYFKAETFQKTGAFKFRGICHALACLSESELVNGVVTYSTGNLGIALAAAAQQRGIRCVVVMPLTASRFKVEIIKSYGAEVVLVNDPAEMPARCKELSNATMAHIISPNDDESILLGQGTAMYEFRRQLRDIGVDLDAVIIPVGTGGLLSGTSVACLDSGIRVFGAEPALASHCYHMLQSGGQSKLSSASLSIADGLMVEVGMVSFQLIQKHVEKVFTVTESQIASAMKIVSELLKVRIEASAAVPVAVLLFQKDFREILRSGVKKVGIILSGGNVDTGHPGTMTPWTRFKEEFPIQC